MTGMREWEAAVPAADRAIYERAGFHHRQPFGRRPVLLVIDVVLSFTGSERRPVLDAMGEYPSSCGDAAHDALPQIRRLVDGARHAAVPVVFSKLSLSNKRFCGDTTKTPADPVEQERRAAAPVHPLLAPRPEEWQLDKTKTSIFFGTPLATYLAHMQADCLLACGVSTSGCVRATCLDGWQHGYPVFLVEEACFDRSRFFHNVTLYDLNAKFANVITLDEALAELAALPPRGSTAG